MTLHSALPNPPTKPSHREGQSVYGFVVVCLVTLAVNSVLIQTVLPEDSRAKVLVRSAVLVLALFALLIGNAKVPRWYLAAFVACFGMLAFRDNADQLSYLFILALIPLMQTIRERRLELVVVLTSVGALALVFVLLAAGLTENATVDSTTIAGSRSRMTFGTYGVPFFFNLVYGAFATLIYYTQKYRTRLFRFTLLASTAAATVLFALTDARGGFAALMLFVALLLVTPKLAGFSTFRGVLAILPLFNLLLAFYIASLGNNAKANDFLSYRPRFYAIFLDSLEFDDLAFSLSVKQFDVAGSIVDNSYLHMLVGGSVAVFAIFVVLYFRAIRRLFSEQRYHEIAALTATSIYANSESILLRTELAFILFTWYLVLRFSQSRADRNQDPLDLPHKSLRDGAR